MKHLRFFVEATPDAVTAILPHHRTAFVLGVSLDGMADIADPVAGPGLVDPGGKRVARNAIHSLACRYNGAEVFRATLSTGIAANPFVRFFLRAGESGDLEFWWLDDDENEGTAKARLVVA